MFIDPRARVGEGVVAGATLTRAEPLTTLPRSARSRVSLVARFKSACHNSPAYPIKIAEARSIDRPAVCPPEHTPQGPRVPPASRRGGALSGARASWHVGKSRTR